MQINLAKNLKYLLACSYGPDSMVLFTLLKKGGYNFEVAHVNYMMRGEESEKETKALLDYCKEHKIVCHYKYIEGRTLKGNFQEEARRVRYEFFKEIIENEGLDVLLTAHHNDDHLETYLMQKESQRTAFYYGIREEAFINNIRIMRPLLGYGKEEIMAFAANNNVSYGIDSSNLKTKYTRNKLRHNVLKAMDYAAKSALNEEIELKNEQAKSERSVVIDLINNNTVIISEFLRLPEKKRKHVIYELFYNSGIVTSFSGPKAENVIMLINSDKSSAFQKISGDIYLVKFAGKISFINIKDYQTYSYSLIEPKLLITKHFQAQFDNIEAIPYINKDQYPLIITVAKKDDFYKIKSYEKKVARLYIDMKLPRHYRLIWPIVKNKDGEIIYIPRYRSDYKPVLHSLFTIFLN